MHSLFQKATAGLLVFAMTAQPALADRNDHDRRGPRWDDRNPHHSYRHNPHRARYSEQRYHDHHIIYAPSRSHRTVTVYQYAPPPVVRYREAYPAYPAPIYRTAVRCTDNYNPLGALVGGIAGGVIGSNIGKGHGRTAATISGVVLGGATGGALSRYCSEEVFQQAAVGVPVSWQAANSQEYYSVTPTRDYREDGRYCREYQAIAKVGGRVRDTYGRACMQPDGSWEIVD